MQETGDTTLSDKPTSSGEIQTIAKKSDQDDPTYLVYYGDPPCSIRELCKRYCFTRAWKLTAASANTVRTQALRNKNMPYHTGWDPEGVDTAEDGTTPLTVGPMTYINWFTPAYAGVRGALRKKYFFTSANAAQSPHVSRSGYFDTGNGVVSFSTQDIAVTANQATKFFSSRYNNGASQGTAATNLGINNTIEVELPYYWDRRFSAARTVRAQNLQCNSHRVITSALNVNPPGPDESTYGIVYQQHDAVGEDFSLMFYTGVPIYYNYAVNELS
jgi:hypothetical protein